VPEALSDEKLSRPSSGASYVELGLDSLDDFVPEEAVVSDLDASILDPNVRNTTLMNWLFCSPYTVDLTSTVTEFGRQDHGAARHLNPKAKARATASGQSRVDGMTRFYTQHDGLQAREPGIHYIMAEDDLEFGSASVLRLSSEFLIGSDVTGVGCGWQVGPASVKVEKLRRHVRCVARAEGDELAGRQQCTDLGYLCMIVLHASGESKRTTLLCDEAEACDKDCWCMEEWGGISLEGYDVRAEKCNSSEEAREIARKWIDGDPSKMAEWRAEARCIWLKQGGGHPACVKTGRWSAYASGLAFCCLPSSWKPLRPWEHSAEHLRVSMDLYVYEAKRYAWVGTRLDQGPIWRCRLDLKDTLDHDDIIPVRTIGQLVSDLNQELFESSQLPVMKASAVRLTRVMEDFTELWTSRRWAMHVGSLLVVLQWASVILQNPLIIGLVFPCTTDSEGVMKRDYFIAFSISTFILVWLEVRVALCCETGRKLYANEHLSFLKFVALSILEKYDIYGDLNFVEVAKLHHQEWIWRVALGVFLVGVVIMQMLPSILIMLRCRFNWFAQVVPHDLSLLCRFSGLHVLMQSINPVHARVASEVAARQDSGQLSSEQIDEAGKDDDDCKDLEMGRPMLQESPGPRQREAQGTAKPTLQRAPERKSGMRAKTRRAVSAFCGGSEVPSEEFCDLPPLPSGLVKEKLLKVVETSRVKVHVGFVRLLFEDLLQGLLQLSFLASHWSTLGCFQVAQVIVSVCVSVAISVLGPMLEQRKYSQATKQLEAYEAWVAAGGECVSALRSTLEAEAAASAELGARLGDGRVDRLAFERPIRCLTEEGSGATEGGCLGAASARAERCRRCLFGCGEAAEEESDAAPEVLRNGTVAGPGQVIRGQVVVRPQCKFPAATTQYVCGLADEMGAAVGSAAPLLEVGPEGRDGQAKVVDFQFTAPQRAGTYSVGWHEDMQHRMKDAVANFTMLRQDRILGYIHVQE